MEDYTCILVNFTLPNGFKQLTLRLTHPNKAKAYLIYQLEQHELFIELDELTLEVSTNKMIYATLEPMAQQKSELVRLLKDKTSHIDRLTGLLELLQRRHKVWSCLSNQKLKTHELTLYKDLINKLIDSL